MALASKTGNESNQQREGLPKSELKTVLLAIKALPIEAQLRDSISQSLSENAYRMEDQAYRQRGLLIGAVPLSRSTVVSQAAAAVQKRIKQVGQRSYQEPSKYSI